MFAGVKLYRNLAEAVVDNLREIVEGKRYADKVIERSLRSNPRRGARDRRFVAETTYDIVRWYRLFTELTGAGPNAYWKLFGAWCLFNNIDLPAWEELAQINKSEFNNKRGKFEGIRKIRESIPDWLDELGERELGMRWEKELHALNQEASVVLRVNTLKISREGLQKILGDQESVETDPVPGYPDALILRQRQNIFRTSSFKEGLFEVQDAGSQAIAPFLDVQPGMRVIDACAGGGGKTLHLASLMRNKGRIIALDTEAWKLDELKKRARRAGVSDLVETRVIDSGKVIKRLEGSADRLLLDVPCSGLGVLRRNPDAKWKLTPAFFEKIKSLQQQILLDYSDMLKPGGLLVYSTCSVLPSENEHQVENFLTAAGDRFEKLEQRTIHPSEGFDGFFFCRLKRK